MEGVSKPSAQIDHDWSSELQVKMATTSADNRFRWPDIRKRVEARETVATEIYQIFREHSDWPTYDFVDRQLKRKYGRELLDYLNFLPQNFVLNAHPDRPTDLIAVALPNLSKLKLATSDIDLFLRFLHWAVKQDHHYVPSSPSHYEPLTITGGQFRSSLPGDHQVSDNDLQRLFRVLQNEPGIGDGEITGPFPGQWALTLERKIAKYADTTDIDGYLAVRQQFPVNLNKPVLPLTSSATALERKTTEAAADIRGVRVIVLSQYVVVGRYMRFDEQTRNTLVQRKNEIIKAALGQSTLPGSFLIWAPSGSGKSFFVEETAKSREDIRYLEINVAKLDEAEVVRRLETLDGSSERTLVLIDEVDTTVPYASLFDTLFTHLESARDKPRAFVLVGSGSSSVAGLRKFLASRPKGPDLLTRIPSENGFEIPDMSTLDRAVILARHVLTTAEEVNRQITHAEKTAVLWVAANPDRYNARGIADAARAAVNRMPDTEHSLLLSDFFERGDVSGYEYWAKYRSIARELARTFIEISH